MNTIAATVVALLKNVDAPVLPKRVWLDPPPKAAPMSAPFPVCKRTIIMRAIHTTTCMVINNADTILFLLIVYDSAENVRLETCSADQCTVYIRHVHQL